MALPERLPAFAAVARKQSASSPARDQQILFWFADKPDRSPQSESIPARFPVAFSQSPVGSGSFAEAASAAKLHAPVQRRNRMSGTRSQRGGWGPSASLITQLTQARAHNAAGDKPRFTGVLPPSRFVPPERRR